MPLSEDEQRILRQIEEQLQRDPSFGREIRSRAANSRRLMVLSAVGTVVLLALSVVLLAISPYLAFAVFVGALFAAASAARHLEEVSSTGFTTLGQAMRQRFGRTPPKD